MNEVAALAVVLVPFGAAYWILRRTLGFRPTTSKDRERIAAATLYHYLADRYATPDVFDPASGRLDKRARGRAAMPGILGRKVTFYCCGHSPRGRYLNHPLIRREPTTVFAVAGRAFLAAIGDTKLYVRSWDAAVALNGAYVGPTVGYQSGIDPRIVKGDLRPPEGR